MKLIYKNKAYYLQCGECDSEWFRSLPRSIMWQLNMQDKFRKIEGVKETVIWVTKDWHITFDEKTTYLGHYPCSKTYVIPGNPEKFLEGWIFNYKWEGCKHKPPEKVLKAYHFFKFANE